MNQRDIENELNHASWRAVRPLFLLLVLSFCAMLLFVSTVNAAEPACPWDADCLSWTVASSRTDGSSLAASEIASHRIETAKLAAGPWTTLTTVAMPATTYQRRPVTGTNHYRVVTVLRTGLESGPSNSANSTVVEPAPNPAVLQVVENIGYQINLGSNNRIYFSRAGTVPLGKECNEGMEAMGKHVIQSRDWLKLDAGKTRPRQVFALCEKS